MNRSIASIVSSAVWGLAAFLLVAVRANAADIFWDSSLSGGWNTATNWSTDTIPGVNDNVTIDRPGDLQIAISTEVDINSLSSQEWIVLDSAPGSRAKLVLANDSTMAGGLTFGSISGRTMPVIEGTGDLTIDGTFIWHRGFMFGPGTTTLAPTSTTILSGKEVPTLFARTLENGGTLNYFPEKQGLLLTSTSSSTGSTLRNLSTGVFNLFSDPTSNTVPKLGGASSQIENAGTFNKYGTGDFIVEIPFNNSGILNLYTGKLVLQAESINSGTINVASVAGLSLAANYTNSGTINFEGITTSFNAASLTNLGTLRVAPGNTLTIASARGIGGTIHATAGSNVVLDGTAGTAQEATAIITGPGNVTLTNYAQHPFAGSLQSTGKITISNTVNVSADQAIAGRLDLWTGTLGGSGNITLTNGMDWSGGVIGGSGKLQLAPQSVTKLSSSPGLPTLSRELANAGKIDFDPGASVRLEGGKLTNLASGVVTVRGNGNIHGFNDPKNLFDNQGTLRIEGSSSSTQFLISSVPVVNSGTIELVGPNSKLQINQGGSVSPYTHSGGRIVLDGGRFTVAASSSATSLILQGGSIEGRGVVEVTNVTSPHSIISHGLIAPGLGQPQFGNASLAFSSLELKEDAVTSFMIGGAIPGWSYSTIMASSILGGTLEAKFVNGFESSITSTQKFQIVFGGTPLTGEFLNVANGERLLTADGLGSFLVHYGAGSLFPSSLVVLSDYLPWTAGDLNFDGVVDGADLGVWQAGFSTASGATVRDGDADRDGDVDGADFVIWQTSFSQSSTNAAAVAEPSSAYLALLPLAGWIVARVRNRSHRTAAM